MIRILSLCCLFVNTYPQTTPIRGFRQSAHLACQHLPRLAILLAYLHTALRPLRCRRQGRCRHRSRTSTGPRVRPPAVAVANVPAAGPPFPAANGTAARPPHRNAGTATFPRWFPTSPNVRTSGRAGGLHLRPVRSTGIPSASGTGRRTASITASASIAPGPSPAMGTGAAWGPSADSPGTAAGAAPPNRFSRKLAVSNSIVQTFLVYPLGHRPNRPNRPNSLKTAGFRRPSGKPTVPKSGPNFPRKTGPWDGRDDRDDCQGQVGGYAFSPSACPIIFPITLRAFRKGLYRPCFAVRLGKVHVDAVARLNPPQHLGRHVPKFPPASDLPRRGMP